MTSRTASTHPVTGMFAAVMIAVGVGISGCGRSSPLRPPNALVAPYDTTRGDVLWAVVPPTNESGVGFVDERAVGDAVAAAASQIRGVDVVPVNRTLEAMRASGLDRVTTPAEVQQVARVLGVDAVVVGSLTAFDPYDPPVVGLTLALFGRPDGPARMMRPRTNLLDDPRVLQLQATDAMASASPAMMFGVEPEATSAVHLDARSHDVRLRLAQYAEGRSDPATALGADVYLASSELYTRFAAHQAVGELLDREWLRLARTLQGAEP